MLSVNGEFSVENELQNDLRGSNLRYDEHLIAKLARLYYADGLKQRDLAERLGLSTSTVSRYLTVARERGYVKITVHDPFESTNELEIRIERKFHLKECLIAPHSSNRATLVRHMARLASSYLSRTMQPGELLGLGWGETLRSLAENLHVDQPIKINIIPAIGAMGELASGVYPNAIAAAFAGKLGARTYLVNTPAVLDTEEARRIIEADRSFQHTRRLWSIMTSALLGASDIGENCSLVRRKAVSPETLEELRTGGVHYTMNHNFFDVDGNIVENPVGKRSVSMKMPELKRLRDVVLVAYGPEKVEMISALLRGGHVNALLTDEQTASAVLELSAGE
jgi:DNA-binding transcriptional regulator LsrR (DeoR family)